MTQVSILLADDHGLVRRGLRAALEAQPNWRVCGEAQQGREAVAMAQQLQPDIVILDISMPELNGLEAARQIRNTCKKTRIVILTMHESEDLIREVLAAGAKGYVLKSDADTAIIQAVQAVNNGGAHLTGNVTNAVIDGFLDPPNGPLKERSRLTPREREVVQLVAEGLSNKEVARRLELSPKTVEAHRTNIMHKLQLDSVADLVRFAIRNNIIQA